MNKYNVQHMLHQIIHIPWKSQKRAKPSITTEFMFVMKTYKQQLKTALSAQGIPARVMVYQKANNSVLIEFKKKKKLKDCKFSICGVSGRKTFLKFHLQFISSWHRPKTSYLNSYLLQLFHTKWKSVTVIKSQEFSFFLLCLEIEKFCLLLEENSN